MVEQKRDGLVNLGARDHVVVVDGQHRRARQRLQLIYQERKHVVHEARRRSTQNLGGASANLGRDRAKRFDGVEKEPNRVVVARVEPQPREGTLLRVLGLPGGQKARLPPTRRRPDERESRRRSSGQACEQGFTADHLTGHGGSSFVRMSAARGVSTCDTRRT